MILIWDHRCLTAFASSTAETLTDILHCLILSTHSLSTWRLTNPSSALHVDEHKKLKPLTRGIQITSYNKTRTPSFTLWFFWHRSEIQSLIAERCFVFHPTAFQHPPGPAGHPLKPFTTRPAPPLCASCCRGWELSESLAIKPLQYKLSQTGIFKLGISNILQHSPRGHSPMLSFF